MSPWKSVVACPSCRNIVMNSPPEDDSSEPRELGSPDASSNENGNFLSFYGEVEAKHRLVLVQWLTSLVPSLHLPINVTDGELRACLSNGTVLCQILNRLRPGTVIVVSEPDNFLPSQSENVKTFLKALDGMGLPRFEISDLEKGSMKAVVDCLLTLREKSLQNTLGDNISVTNSNTVSPGGNAPIHFHRSPTCTEEQRKVSAGSTKLQRFLSTPVMAESSASLIHHVGHNFHEVFQLKHGSYADLPAAKIAEMMNSNSIDNAPTQLLLSVVNGILEESFERRNGEIPHRVACLLKKVTQEIERRMSTQAEHLRTQNNLFKAREEKYQSRIRVLETLACGTRDESEICASQFQQLKGEKTKEEEIKVDENEVVRFIKEQEDKKLEISALKIEVVTAKRTYELQLAQLEEAANGALAELTQKAQEYEHQLEELRNKAEKIKEEVKMADEVEYFKLMKEQEDKNLEVSALKRELETVKRTYEVQFSKLEEAKSDEAELAQKVQEYEQKLEELRNTAEKMKEEVKAAYEEEIIRLMNEQEDKNLEISALKRELETAKRTYEVHFSQLEEEAKGAKAELTLQAQEYEHQLEELRNRVEKIKEEVKTADEEEIIRLMKEQEDKNLEISALKQELETTKKTYEIQCSELETEVKDAKAELTQKSQEYEHRLEELRNKAEKIRKEEKKADENVIIRLMKEQEDKTLKISSLKQELKTTKNTYEVQCSQFEGEAKGTKAELEQKSQEYEHQLEELRHKIKELEVSSDSKDQKWNMKMNHLQTVVTFQFSSLQKLKLSWESVKQYVMKEQTVCAEDCDQLGVYLKPLLHAAENYHVLLAENQKMFNEIQELKGNIRVYCRIRPFLSGKKDKQSIVEHMGENDLVVANPSKEGKDAHRSFQFNKVFHHTATQAEVYSDIQSFIRSVLDGYNVCIFAYGQTGSGKTYTMTGPNGATSETIGVNYRALNDLFRISTSREVLIDYEIGVQMVEIYNEQVRDLLITDGSPKRLGILTQSQPKGLVVPDASLFRVKSPSDVIKLMDIGLKNRAIGATAMNERSSRSHCVVSIHVCGKDLNTGSSMSGNLHLVDLAGSERVDRSEVTGDRLKEAQHINKSLSALGDVIFALSQKSPHVPYRNSKLTQLLQTSLGSKAKTLMFVQINSDVTSYSETMSTLKFAQRVSGVELGAAQSSKESKDVIELMEQVSFLKNTILTKEEEIMRLQLLKGSVGSIAKRSQIPRSRSIKHFEADNQQPMDDHTLQNEFLHRSYLYGGDVGKKIAESSGFTDFDFDGRSSDISDSGVTPGTETDGSENSSLTEGTKSSDKKSKEIRKPVQATRKLGRSSSITATTTPVKDMLKKSPGMKKSTSIGNLKPPKLWK